MTTHRERLMALLPGRDEATDQPTSTCSECGHEFPTERGLRLSDYPQSDLDRVDQDGGYVECPNCGNEWAIGFVPKYGNPPAEHNHHTRTRL